MFSGVITNLRISEFDLRHEEDDNIMIIPCVHHKMCAQAMAQLAVTIDIKDILIYYFNNIRSQIEPTKDIHKDNFFVTFNVWLYTQVSLYCSLCYLSHSAQICKKRYLNFYPFPYNVTAAVYAVQVSAMLFSEITPVLIIIQILVIIPSHFPKIWINLCF